MGTIKYEKTMYQKSKVKRIFFKDLRGFTNTSKELQCRNMFARHHITKKNNQHCCPLMSSVRPILDHQHMDYFNSLFLKKVKE